MSFLLNNIPANPAIDRFVDLSFEISEKIIRLLDEKRLTQHDLAIRLGKKDSEISKWLTGNHNFTLRTIAAVETALEDEFVKINLKSKATYTTSVDTAAVVPVTDQRIVFLDGSFDSLPMLVGIENINTQLPKRQFMQPFDLPY